jgi:hypothetical protein
MRAQDAVSIAPGSKKNGRRWSKVFHQVADPGLGA